MPRITVLTFIQCLFAILLLAGAASARAQRGPEFKEMPREKSATMQVPFAAVAGKWIPK